MRRALLVMALIAGLTGPVFASAPPGTAQNFLDRVNRLKSKGPLALFDGDMKRLKAEAIAAGKSIGNQRIAAEKAGGPLPYCSPQPKVKLGQSEFIAGLEAIPAAERSRTSLRAAMLRIIQKKHPCRA